MSLVISKTSLRYSRDSLSRGATVAGIDYPIWTLTCTIKPMPLEHLSRVRRIIQ